MLHVVKVPVGMPVSPDLAQQARIDVLHCAVRALLSCLLEVVRALRLHAALHLGEPRLALAKPIDAVRRRHVEELVAFAALLRHRQHVHQPQHRVAYVAHLLAAVHQPEHVDSAALQPAVRAAVHGLPVLAPRALQPQVHLLVVLAVHQVQLRLLVRRANALQHLRRRVRQAAPRVERRPRHVSAHGLQCVRLAHRHAEALRKVRLRLVAVHPARVRVTAERALCQPPALVAEVQHAALRLLVPRRHKGSARQAEGRLLRILCHRAARVAAAALRQHLQVALLRALLLLQALFLNLASARALLAPPVRYTSHRLLKLLELSARVVLEVHRALLGARRVVLAVREEVQVFGVRLVL